MALEAIADDFLAKTLELGAAIARRRKSDYLTPADLNVALERIWCGPQPHPAVFIQRPIPAGSHAALTLSCAALPSLCCGRATGRGARVRWWGLEAEARPQRFGGRPHVSHCPS